MVRCGPHSLQGRGASPFTGFSEELLRGQGRLGSGPWGDLEERGRLVNGFDGRLRSVMLSWEWATHLISQGKGCTSVSRGLDVGHV